MASNEQPSQDSKPDKSPALESPKTADKVAEAGTALTHEAYGASWRSILTHARPTEQNVEYPYPPLQLHPASNDSANESEKVTRDESSIRPSKESSGTASTTETTTQDLGDGKRAVIENKRGANGEITSSDVTTYRGNDVVSTAHHEADGPKHTLADGSWNSSELHADGSSTVKYYDATTKKTETFAIDSLGNVIPRTKEQMKEAVDSMLKADSANGGFSGSVLVSREGEHVYSGQPRDDVYSGQFGTTDNSTTPIDRNTKFTVCSIGKMFTAAAIMQLVEKQRLSLDAKVGDWLPQYKNNPDVANVTVGELLSHRGGLRDMFPSDDNKKKDEISAPRSIDEAVDYFSKLGDGKGVKGPDGPPNAGEPKHGEFNYSNLGYMLLGGIINEVLNRHGDELGAKDYYDYVNKNIFKKLGMDNTGFDTNGTGIASDGKPIATGFTKQPDGSVQPINSSDAFYRSSPAGGAYSTVDDLVKLANALMGKGNNRLFTDPKWAKEMMTGPDATAGNSYAYGISRTEENGVRAYGHNGGAPGYSAKLTFYPDSGYVVVALANRGDHTADRAVSYIGDRLPN